MLLQRDVAPGVHRIEDAWVNWYLVEAPETRAPLTVVDAGLPGSWGSLRAALRQLGRSLDDVGAVVLTHGHFDHIGFAERARRELRVPVWVHAPEAPLVRTPMRFDTERRSTPYAVRNPNLVRVAGSMVRLGALRTRGVREPQTFTDGQVLDVPCGLVAVATPGHTVGHCAFLLPDRNALISGDALVTYDPYTRRRGPNLVSRAASTSTAQAAASLQRIGKLEATTLLPGHGEPWHGTMADAARTAAAGPIR